MTSNKFSPEVRERAVRLVLEHGRITLDIPVDLPRPRRHSTPGFSELWTPLLEALGVKEGRPAK